MQKLLCGALLLASFSGFASDQVASAQVNVTIDLEKAPFHYSNATPNNRVSRLLEKLRSGEFKLEYSRGHGYLRALLKALEISESSQVLVFSQTSLQVEYISPRNPRAIYFNDDTYVGWVNGSPLVEISTADPKLGAAFYTVDMMPWRAKIERATYDCLACHSTAMTQGIPGHTVRSIHPNYDGRIDSNKPSFISDDKSPFSERWGGWYVTGKHGAMKHMGNSYLRGGLLDTDRNGNRSNLADLFDTSNYLSPYSDIVALMVLEHQTQMHNEMSRANFYVRKMLHDGQDSRDAKVWQQQLSLIAKEVVDRLLFCGEFQLTDDVRGSVVFQHDFLDRGPRDSRGRSLREFDLKRRLFKYPLSYLIYSRAFDTLEPVLRDEISAQLSAILSGENQSPDYSHLDRPMRSELSEILRETKPAMFGVAPDR